MRNHEFSLCRLPWLILSGGKQVGLLELFGMEEPVHLGGNPLQQFLAFRLLLAIVQNVIRLSSNDELEDLTIKEMKSRVSDYLHSHEKCFDLYDEQKPFLQIAGLTSKKPLKIGGLIPGVSSGNTTVLNDGNLVKNITDSEKVYVLLQQILYAFSGKKPDHTILLGKGVKKSKSAPAAPAVGYLHCFVLGHDLMHSLLLNLLTEDDLEEIPSFSEGFGIAPWECMPTTENCPVAEKLKNSYLGRLIPLARFCRIDGQLLHMTEGITLPTLSISAFADLSIPISISQKNGKIEAKGTFARREKQPWRQLEAILGFMDKNSSYHCKQLSICLDRDSCEGRRLGIWCVGMQLTSQAGEQYLSGKDGFVESQILLESNVEESMFYARYCSEIKRLEKLAKSLSLCIKKYFDDMGSKTAADSYSRQGFMYFWQNASGLASELTHECQEKTSDHQLTLRRKFAEVAVNVYKRVCREGNSRQTLAYTKNYPRLSWYLNVEK